MQRFFFTPGSPPEAPRKSPGCDQSEIARIGKRHHTKAVSLPGHGLPFVCIAHIHQGNPQHGSATAFDTLMKFVFL